MFSFPKSSRLTRQADFERLKGEDVRRIGNGCFGIRWREGDKRRLGVMVGKKVGKAHRRNLVKRVVRELFRLHPGLFPMGDILVIARPGLADLKKNEICKRFKSLLSRNSP